MLHAMTSHRDLGPSESRAGIESNAITTGRPVYLYLASVRLEAMSCILGRNTTLDGEASFCDCFLRESKLSESSTCSDLNLCRNNINASDFLYIGDRAVRRYSTTSGRKKTHQ